MKIYDPVIERLLRGMREANIQNPRYSAIEKILTEAEWEGPRTIYVCEHCGSRNYDRFEMTPARIFGGFYYFCSDRHAVAWLDACCHDYPRMKP